MLQLSQFLWLYHWVWKPDLMNFLLWSQFYSIKTWSFLSCLEWALCVSKYNQESKRQWKETSLFNPGGINTELIFTTDLRIPAVTNKSATKSGTVITSFISVQSLRAGLYLWCVMLAGPSFLQSPNWWLIDNLGEADLIVNIPLNKIKQDQAREVNMT